MSKLKNQGVKGLLPGLSMSLVGLFFLGGCGMHDEDLPRGLRLDEDTAVLMQELSAVCTVQVEGYGAVDMESDYLPSVVACENGNAPMEALKAQAVAARTYAAFITVAEQRALKPTEADQVYGCSYAPVEERHRQAVAATAGQVLTHNDRMIAGFYVAGNTSLNASCEGTPSQANTERFVTYNQGRIGNEVRPTSLGHRANPANRGAKSQNGAACLANQGWDYERILRFYYGDDARARVPDDSQCAGGGAPGGSGDDICRISAASGEGARGGTGSPGCVDPSTAPHILPRSAWNARPPRMNRGRHTPNKITVHHTVTPNNAADGAHWVRQVQRWHMIDNGWADIGYHFLISWDGTIYRGNPEDRIGSHARNFNSGNLGIALIGRYDTGNPSEAQVKALTQMLRYLGDKYSIELNRTQIKGHGEWSNQATACPGQNLRRQLDDIVNGARGDSVCQGGDSSPENPETGGDVPGYRYVRVSGLSYEPRAENDLVDGFEVDSIYFERHNGGQPTVIQARRVLCSPGVSNPGGALGPPDNGTCEDRTQTVAGVPPGADLVVELNSPMQIGDQLFVTQHNYFPADANCRPTGTAQISVSNDGRIWKVLDRDARGNWRQTLTTGDFVINENDETQNPDNGFELISPRAGHWYTPEVTFSALANNPAVVTVEYLADTWKMGESTNRGNNFAFTYEFEYFGERVILARGLDASGTEVATKEITITVTDFFGNIPEGKEVIPPLPSPNVADSVRAEQLAVEGGKCFDPTLESTPRCSNGTGGYSTGQCWRFVKRALERAGINYNLLQHAGPCNAYTFQLSAYGFRCNADPNPEILRQAGLMRIDVPVQQAPRGALISWQHGCAGFHTQHGHIEISQGNGIACSDYCGAIRPGGNNCASVYVPVAD